MATYTIETMFLVTSTNRDGDKIGASGFDRSSALEMFYKQCRKEQAGVIEILEITTSGVQISKEFIYPDLPNLDYLNNDACACSSTQCAHCHTPVPEAIAFDFYNTDGWEPEPFDPVAFIEELYDTTIDEYSTRLNEQLAYVRANATDQKRQQLLKEGLR